MYSSIEQTKLEVEEIDAETYEIALDKFETVVDVENDLKQKESAFATDYLLLM